MGIFNYSYSSVGLILNYLLKILSASLNAHRMAIYTAVIQNNYSFDKL